MPVARIRTTSKRKKALAQYHELRQSPNLKGAVIIALLADGNYEVLGQELSLGEIADALLAAATAVSFAKEREDQTRLDPAVIPEEPEPMEPLGRKRVPEIVTKPDGELIAPQGEAFILCSECGASKWFVLSHEADGAPARYACVGCGNEIKLLMFTEAQHGRA